MLTTYNEYVKYYDLFLSRLESVIKTFVSLHNGKLAMFYCTAVDEEHPPVDLFDPEIQTIENIRLEFSTCPEDKNLSYIDSDGELQQWEGEIPVSWLFDDSFVEEVKDGIKKYRLTQEKPPPKKDKNLVEDILKRFSKKELDALKEHWKVERY